MIFLFTVMPAALYACVLILCHPRHVQYILKCDNVSSCDFAACYEHVNDLERVHYTNLPCTVHTLTLMYTPHFYIKTHRRPITIDDTSHSQLDTSHYSFGLSLTELFLSCL